MELVKVARIAGKSIKKLKKMNLEMCIPFCSKI